MLIDRFIYVFPKKLHAKIVKMLLEDSVPIRDRRPDLPEGLAAIIHRALARDPQARYPNARRSPGALALRHVIKEQGPRRPLDRVPPARAYSGNCQRRTVVSSLPETARRPSGEKATEFTPMECPSIRHTSLPLARSHKWTGPSRPPDKARRQSGENTTHLTCLSSLFNRLSSFPLATSHKRAVLSRPPERMSRPSAEQATLATAPM